MRRAFFATFALTLAACAPARAQSPPPPDLPAPQPSGAGRPSAPARPGSGSLLAPHPSVEAAPALTPVRRPVTPSSLIGANPYLRRTEPAPAVVPPGALAAPPPPAGFDPKICEGRRGLSSAQAEACRVEFQRKVEADRARIEAKRLEEQIAREERAARRGPRLKPRETPLDFFLAEDLVFGDVVMTDKGARVFIGKKDATPRREDFVPLDDPRSPRREAPPRMKRAPPGL